MPSNYVGRVYFEIMLGVCISRSVGKQKVTSFQFFGRFAWLWLPVSTFLKGNLSVLLTHFSNPFFAFASISFLGKAGKEGGELEITWIQHPTFGFSSSVSIPEVDCIKWI